MKLILALIAVLQASVTVAAPPPPADAKNPIVPRADVPLKLRAVAPGAPFDGRFFSSNESAINLFTNSPSNAPLRVYAEPGPNPAEGRLAIRKFPRDEAHNELALLGKPGLESIVSFFEVRAVDPLPPSRLSFGGWTITPPFSGGYEPKTTKHFLDYKRDGQGTAAASRWIAFPSATGYDVKYYDGSVIVTQNYFPLKIEVVKA
ncbi:MAG: hypothetical protein M1825_005615 [Sarcosagium campestre]|nr:MAG: hypothetical protein M1825_005615 [Sarcosagium campestre]